MKTNQSLFKCFSNIRKISNLPKQFFRCFVYECYQYLFIIALFNPVYTLPTHTDVCSEMKKKFLPSEQSMCFSVIIVIRDDIM